MQNPKGTMMRPRFLGLSAQYYVAARSAAFSGFSIAGNLVHHAVELAAKAQLVDMVSEAALKKKPYGHNLALKLWPDYKAAAGTGLDKFDALVTGIHAWEDIRYMPSEALSIVTSVATPTWKGSADQRATVSTEPAPGYELDLGEVDELISEMYRRLGYQADTFLHGEAKTWLLRDNRYFT